MAHYGWAATEYKVSKGIASLPDLAIALVEYNEETEIGREVLFHRIPAGKDQKQSVEYIIDPAYWINPSLHVRTDIKGFPTSWYIGVTPAKKANGK